MFYFFNKSDGKIEKQKYRINKISFLIDMETDEMSNLKKYFIILIVLTTTVLTFRQSNAQLDFRISYHQEYNNNPLRLPNGEESWISNFHIGAEKSFEKLMLGYYGNYSHFTDISERNYYWHQMAVVGGSDTTGWGIYGEQQINKADFDIFDYKELDAYLRHRLIFGGLSTYLYGRIQFNFYDQLSELNNTKFNASVRVQKTFPTRTTLISGLSFDLKNYMNTDPTVEFIADSNVTTLSKSSMTSSTLNGNGKHGNNRGGRGYRNFENGGQVAPNSYVDLENSSVTQLSLWARLAQSITPTTGIAIQYHNRHLLTGSDRFVSGLADIYNQESGIFNDPMGYESHSYNFELTKILPGSMMFKLTAYYADKNYSSEGIYENEENYSDTTFRNDKYKTIFASLAKDFGISTFNGTILTFNINYQWIDNQSNSYWYEYQTSHISAGFELQF